MLPRPDGLLWAVEGENGMELHGYHDDILMAIVSVKESNTWTFRFPGHKGQGTIRVGSGCNYNPLHMVEILRHHFIDDEPPLPTKTEKPNDSVTRRIQNAEFSEDWVKWDDRWSDRWS